MPLTGGREMLRSLSLATLAVLVLRGAPAVVAALAPEPADGARLPVGYLPKDFLQYVAFVRQAAETGDWWLENPFTTEPQSGRFLVLFLAALGHLCRATGLDPFVALELSRLPAYALFFGALGMLVREAFADRSERRAAIWLVALSGGFGWLGRLAVPALPQPAADVVAQNLWRVYGWSTFESFHNPMWTVGLALTAFVVLAAGRPEGPRGPAEVAKVAAALVGLYAIHAYSAIVAGSLVAVRLVREACAAEPAAAGRARRLLVVLVAAAAVVVPVALWQLGDPAFRESAGGVIGAQFVSLFWYPLGLGALGLFAWIGSRPPHVTSWTREIAWWAGTVAVLHNLPGLNGYHFLFHLHLPLALLAAPVVTSALRGSDGARRGALLAALFLSSASVTVEAIHDVVRWNVVPRGWVDSARALADRPRGNVLAPQPAGNVIPAWGAHRVWVGHWFLSPDARERALRVDELFADPRAHADALRELVTRERIRYVVVPEERAPEVASALGIESPAPEPAGDFAVLTLGD